MKIWSNEHIFNHSWDTVVQAAIQKYPNPMNPSVMGIDVVDRQVNNIGIIKTHRLFTTKWNLQPWASKILGGDRLCHASEHSEIDANKKTLTLRTRNLTFSNILNVDETLVYKQDPNDENKTILTQEANISVKNVPLTSYLETVIANTMTSNAQKGRLAIEWVITRMDSISIDAKKTVTNTIRNF
jgi:hypothetical protein